jgi:hypothetical protein
MERIFVSSSNLCSVGYDEEKCTLEIEFNSGLIYQYLGVPVYHFIGLLNALSVGKYFDRYIRKMGYRYRQLSGLG